MLMAFGIDLTVQHERNFVLDVLRVDERQIPNLMEPPLLHDLGHCAITVLCCRDLAIRDYVRLQIGRLPVDVGYEPLCREERGHLLDRMKACLVSFHFVNFLAELILLPRFDVHVLIHRNGRQPSFVWCAWLQISRL